MWGFLFRACSWSVEHIYYLTLLLAIVPTIKIQEKIPGARYLLKTSGMILSTVGVNHIMARWYHSFSDSKQHYQTSCQWTYSRRKIMIDRTSGLEQNKSLIYNQVTVCYAKMAPLFEYRRSAEIWALEGRSQVIAKSFFKKTFFSALKLY